MTLFVDDEFTDFYTEAYINQEYPEHIRTSCSDERPDNADVIGHGCWRCNALFFQRAERQRNQLNAIRNLATPNFVSTHSKVDLATRITNILKAST